MRRTKSFDEMVSKKLQNLDFAQHYILALMEGEEGMSIEDAIRHTIGRMGVKEFSKKTKIAPPNIVRFLKEKVKASPETINKLLKPFGLKIEMVIRKVS